MGLKKVEVCCDRAMSSVRNPLYGWVKELPRMILLTTFLQTLCVRGGMVLTRPSVAEISGPGGWRNLNHPQPAPLVLLQNLATQAMPAVAMPQQNAVPNAPHNDTTPNAAFLAFGEGTPAPANQTGGAFVP